MASTPIPDNLTIVLARLADRLESLEARLDRIEASAGPMIASISSGSKKAKPSPPTKGKGRADAPQAPSSKKERSTRKPAIASATVPLPLAQTFTTEGKTDRHLVTVVIPDASAQHVIGQGGKGLKQVHDISGARVNAYTLASDSRDERHVSIRGTDIQIGDALVVLGKRIARKKVRPPKTKKTGPKDSSQSAPLPPIQQQSSALPRHSSTQRSGPSTEPRIVEVPTGEPDIVTPVVPSVVMASPSPASTPIVPSVTMGSPSPYRSDDALTPMEIDAIRQRFNLPSSTGHSAQHVRGLNTARRSGPRPAGQRGRG
jgi:KH domain